MLSRAEAAKRLAETDTRPPELRHLDRYREAVDDALRATIGRDLDAIQRDEPEFFGAPVSDVDSFLRIPFNSQTPVAEIVADIKNALDQPQDGQSTVDTPVTLGRTVVASLKKLDAVPADEGLADYKLRPAENKALTDAGLAEWREVNRPGRPNRLFLTDKGREAIQQVDPEGYAKRRTKEAAKIEKDRIAAEKHAAAVVEREAKVQRDLAVAEREGLDPLAVRLGGLAHARKTKVEEDARVEAARQAALDLGVPDFEAGRDVGLGHGDNGMAVSKAFTKATKEVAKIGVTKADMTPERRSRGMTYVNAMSEVDRARVDLRNAERRAHYLADAATADNDPAPYASRLDAAEQAVRDARARLAERVGEAQAAREAFGQLLVDLYAEKGRRKSAATFKLPEPDGTPLGQVHERLRDRVAAIVPADASGPEATAARRAVIARMRQDDEINKLLQVKSRHDGRIYQFGRELPFHANDPEGRREVRAKLDAEREQLREVARQITEARDRLLSLEMAEKERRREFANAPVRDASELDTPRVKRDDDAMTTTAAPKRYEVTITPHWSEAQGPRPTTGPHAIQVKTFDSIEALRAADAGLSGKDINDLKDGKTLRIGGETTSMREVGASTPARSSEPTIGVKVTSKGRTTTVTLPDGTVAERTSKTRSYTHAVVATRDLHQRAQQIQADTDRRQAFVDALQAWIDRGANTDELKAYPSGSLSYNDEQAGKSRNEYYLPGFEPVRKSVRRGRDYWDDPMQFSLPNFKDTTREGTYEGMGKYTGPELTAWERRGPSYVLGRQRAHIESNQKQAAELNAGPRYAYEVIRWSSSRNLAQQAAGSEFSNPWTTYRVIGVGDDLTGQTADESKPVKVKPTVEERAAAKAARAEQEKADRAKRGEEWTARKVADIKRHLTEGSEQRARSEVISTNDQGLRMIARAFGIKSTPRGMGDRQKTEWLRNAILEAAKAPTGRPSGLPAKPASSDFEDLASRVSVMRTEAEIVAALADLNGTELASLARKFAGGPIFLAAGLNTRGGSYKGVRLPEGMSTDQRRQWLANFLIEAGKRASAWR